MLGRQATVPAHSESLDLSLLNVSLISLYRSFLVFIPAVIHILHILSEFVAHI